MTDVSNSSGTLGEHRKRKWWRRWLPGRRARALISYMAVRLVFLIIRILLDD